MARGSRAQLIGLSVGRTNSLWARMKLGRAGDMKVIRLVTSEIMDWDTFHRAFIDALGFPAFYGCNMNAWIDCMTYLDDPDAGMTKVTVDRGAVLTVQLEDVDEFAVRCPELYVALVECAAFVNWRRIEQGEAAVLALSYFGRR